MKKYKYKVSGLDCAACAAGVERKIAEQEGLHNVSLNFASETLTFEADDSLENPLEKVEEIIKKSGHTCEISPAVKGSEKKHSSEHSHDHEHEHSHEHSHEHGSGDIKKSLILICVSAVFLVLGFMPFFEGTVSNVLLIISAAVCGFPVLIEAFHSLMARRADENLLVAIAVIAAFIIGEYKEAASVIMFFSVGELLEDYAVSRSRRSIAALSQIRPDKANILLPGGEIRTVSAEEIKIGDTIKILPFERFPVDCEVIDGITQVDCSPVTGESLPVEVTAGKTVLSGCINQTGEVIAKAAATSENSAASRIIDMVESAASRKGKAEKTVTKLAVYYTPTVIALAAALALLPPLFGMGSLSMWVQRSLVFLVASCPCALVLSVPLGFFAGIGGASKRGILVKGGTFVELVSKAKAVVFDKTGTLTCEENEIESVRCAEGFTQEDVLRYASYGEHFSVHPLAECVRRAYTEIDEKKISGFEEIPGNGTKINLDGEEIICGSRRFLENSGIDTSSLGEAGAQIFVGVSGKAAGAINIESKLREDSAEAIRQLKALGIKHIAMLTGDHEDAAKSVADRLGIDEYYAGLLPEDKLSILEKIKSESGITIFAGDGINDAPVLACAHAGAAMGLGSDAAIEAGDLVLMGSKPSSIATAISLFRKTMSIVHFNIWFALGVKAIVLILGAFGLASMWMAVFADVGVALIAIANSARLINGKTPEIK